MYEDDIMCGEMRLLRLAGGGFWWLLGGGGGGGYISLPMVWGVIVDDYGWCIRVLSNKNG